MYTRFGLGYQLLKIEVHGIQGVRHWVDNIGAGMIANNTILGVSLLQL